MSKRFAVLCLMATLCLYFAPAQSATLPPGFSETLVTNGLDAPTPMEFAPDGRLFICQQGGALRVIKNGALLPAPFVSLTVDDNGERGLLGIAFDPQFASNNFVYVYYTATSPSHNRVSRFTANGDVALVGSETILLELENLNATNHNGGAIHFGTDGKLYVAVGENANASNAQTLTNRLGKILRINKDGSIPDDNPFYSTASGVNRSIWALGLRNPFTFDIHRTSGRILINDVGQGSREEINDGIAGSNYGWPSCEGDCASPNPEFRDPVFDYGHGQSTTTGNAIVGGAFYDQAVQFPATYQNKYFFADLTSGWIRVFNPADNTAEPFATGIPTPVDLRVGTDGSLYYLARGSSSVLRVRYNTNATYTLSGRVADPGGVGLTGVNVARSGSSTPAVTNGAGYYTFTGVPTGIYNLVPSKAGLVFSPAIRGVMVNGANVASHNFLGIDE